MAGGPGGGGRLRGEDKPVARAPSGTAPVAFRRCGSGAARPAPRRRRRPPRDGRRRGARAVGDDRSSRGRNGLLGAPGRAPAAAAPARSPPARRAGTPADPAGQERLAAARHADAAGALLRSHRRQQLLQLGWRDISISALGRSLEPPRSATVSSGGADPVGEGRHRDSTALPGKVRASIWLGTTGDELARLVPHRARLRPRLPSDDLSLRA